MLDLACGSWNPDSPCLGDVPVGSLRSHAGVIQFLSYVLCGLACRRCMGWRCSRVLWKFVPHVASVTYNLRVAPPSSPLHCCVQVEMFNLERGSTKECLTSALSCRCTAPVQCVDVLPTSGGCVCTSIHVQANHVQRNCIWCSLLFSITCMLPRSMLHRNITTRSL